MTRSPADVDAVAHVFVESLADRCAIGGDDGHHLQRVRRLRPGEIVTAADGSGLWRTYEIVRANAGVLDLDARSAVAAEPVPPIAVAVALPPAKAGLDAVVASLTELGVVRITPVRTARGVVRWDESKSVRAVERMRALAREAAMQCRRARVPSVDALTDLSDLAAQPGVVVADRTGTSAAELAEPDGGVWTVVVGPEGGLAPEESAIFADRPRLAVGRYVLRAVTAPVVAVAVLTDRIAEKWHA